MRITAALLTTLLLAGCSSIPIGGASPAPQRGFDPGADLSGLIVVLDLPQSLEPLAGNALTFDLVAASGGKHVKAVLVPTDPGDLAESLPPPAADRSYYMLGLSEPDRQSLRDAQAWSKTAPDARLSVNLVPAVCRTDVIDPARTTISALVALPGTPGVAPLLGNAPVAAAVGQNIPACAGHSG